MATRVTGSKFKNYYTPWFSYDITANNATTYTFKLNLGVVSTKTVASQCGSGSRINKKVGSGSWTGTTVGHIVDLPAKSDTTVLSNDVWSVTKTHTTQTVTIDGVVSVLDSGTDIGHATKTFTIPARTSYLVTYNANSGSGAPAQQTKWHGEELTLSSVKPTKTGYTFKGWAISEAKAKAGEPTYQPGPDGTVAANTNSKLDLWAVWELTYQKPTITNCYASRCASNGDYKDEGKYAKITFDWSVFRSQAAQYYGASSPTPYASNTPSSCTVKVGDVTKNVSLSGSSGTTDPIIVGTAGTDPFKADTTYPVVVTLTDSTSQSGKTVTYNTNLRAAVFPLDFNSSATALGIFQPAPDDETGIFFGRRPIIKNNLADTSTFYKAERTDTNVVVNFGVGSGGENHGVFSETDSRWIIYDDANGDTIIPAPTLRVGGNLITDGYFTSAITACGATDTADLALSTSEKKVTLSSNRARVGADLTNNNGGVKCAKGGYVEVSGAIYCVSGFNANDLVHLVIKKNSTNIINAVHRLPNNYDYYSIAPIIYSVSAGDMLYLYAYNQTAARGQINAATLSWLTVKYL